MMPARLLQTIWHRSSRHAALFTLFLLSALTLGALIGTLSGTRADDVQYFYDPGGRLIGVLDPVNGSAQYTYDQSGNITSIVRNPLSTLTVLQFSPNSGPVGTTVTISGTAFGDTSNTSVSFNGVLATPSAVTATSITVAVPAGATSGPISVTAPSGTVATSSSFSVGAPSAPTIASFTTGTSTPTIAPPGATVTISGTNFDPTYTKVFVSGQFAQVTSATPTSLAIVVPTSSSGKIVVTTPAGSATSGSDLIVAPPPFAATAVGASVRTAIGQPAVTVNQNGSGTVSLVLFDVTAGQRVNVRLSDTGSPGCNTWSVLGPNGAVVFAAATLCANTAWSGQLQLPQAGTYTIQFNPAAGSGTFTAQIINVPADVTSSVSTTGVTSAILVTTPGQHGSFTFSGTAGQKVTVLVDFSNLTTNCGTYAIINPIGVPFVPATASQQCGRNYVNAAVIALPQTGTFTVAIVPSISSGLTDGTGSVSVTIFTPPADPTASLAFGGTEATFTLTTPGQNGSFTFSGTAGQIASLLLDFGQLNNCGTYTIVKPDSSNFIGPTFQCGSSYVQGAPITLPQSGTYTVKVAPKLQSSMTDGAGIAFAAIFAVPADATGTVAIGGNAAPISISTPGQNGSLTFSGTASQKVSIFVAFSSVTTNCGNYTILNPSGSTFSSGGQCGSGYVSGGAVTLPQTGTYTMKLSPWSSGSPTAGTGVTYVMIFSVPADATATVTIGAATSTMALTAPGQRGTFSFSGTTGQKINVLVDFGQLINCGSYSILNPSGSTLVGSTGSCGRSTVNNLTLPQTGTYTIPISNGPGGSATGGTRSVAVTLSVAP
jgi:YD repeat-containing protein